MKFYIILTIIYWRKHQPRIFTNFTNCTNQNVKNIWKTSPRIPPSRDRFPRINFDHEFSRILLIAQIKTLKIFEKPVHESRQVGTGFYEKTLTTNFHELN